MMWSDDDQPVPESRGPTSVRYFVVFATFLTSILLYLDRFCMTYVQRYIKEDFGLTNRQIEWCMSAFFATYALAQVPSGGLTDRFGARRMLTWYVLGWSLFTAAMGWVGGLVGLLLVRMAAGASQAGAYPTAARIVGHWVPLTRRGLASSAIALGGRVGGAIAPLLTALLVIAFVPRSTSPLLTSADLLDARFLCDQLSLAGAADVTTDTSGQPLTKDAIAALSAARVVRAGLPPGAATVVDRLGREYAGAAEVTAGGERSLGKYEPAVRRRMEPPDDADRADLAEGVNSVLSGPLLLPAGELAELPIEREARRLLRRSETLSSPERVRLNRLALEAVFPDAVRKIYVHGWQPVMWIYGAAGLFVAGWFYFQVRDEPRNHPRVNEFELDLIEAGRDRPAAAPVTSAQSVPMRAILRHRSLWFLNVAQFGTNVGWAFLVTLLDRYLYEVHRVPYVDRGLMQMVPLFVGWGGMLAGGWLTDRLSRGLGLRAGRALPVGMSRFVAMGAFLLLLFEPSPWTCTILFAAVAFGTDMGSPAVWAYYQDVGGRSIAAVLGWGNMWGNFGAMASPLLIGWIAETWSWNAAFTTCAAAFLLAGVCGLAIDATRPVVELARDSREGAAGHD